MSENLDPTRPQDDAEAWETPTRLVKLSAPAGASDYYRLEWREPDTGERGQTTGGRTFDKAWGKAIKKEKSLVAGETEKHQQPASVGITYWLDPARKTPKTENGWGDSHRSHMDAYAREYFTPLLGKVKLVELRRRHFQKVIDSAPTKGEGQNLRRAATSLIAALHQGDLLPEDRTIDLKMVWWHGASVVEVEETEDTEDAGTFVALVKRPSNDQVRTLRESAEALPARGTATGTLWWRGLMVETAAYAGPRWSELIALTADDVLPNKRHLRIHWRVSQPAGKPRRLTAPKMARRRTTIYPAATPTGYRLEASLRRRALDARAEQLAGTNPRALLFPNSAGDWMFTGNFHRDIFAKAARNAEGWEAREVVKSNGRGKTKTIQQWKISWHGLRHTYCTFSLEEWCQPPSVVSKAAGHADTSTTMRLYVNADDGALDRAVDAPEPWAL